MAQITPPFRWDVGEHLAVIGRNGSGKTFATAKLLEMRRYVIVARTKVDRPEIKFPGFVKYTDPSKLVRSNDDKILLDVSKDFRAIRARKLAYLFDLVLKQKNWTLDIDETFYVMDRLKLEEPIEELLTQGRGLGISVVCTMQRPVRISRFVLSECTHVLCFAIEGRDRRELAISTSDVLANAVADLDPEKHQFAWWYKKRPNRIWIGKVQDLGVTL